MDCSGIADHLSPLADGELESEKVESVRAHLKNCPRCTRLFEIHVNVKQFLPQILPFKKAPPGLRAAILDRLGSTGASNLFHVFVSRLRAQPFLASVVAVTIFLAAFAGVLWLVNSQRLPLLIREVLHNHEEAYLHPLDVASANVGNAARELALRIRRKIGVPDLRSRDLTLRGFRQCPVCLKSAVEIRYWQPPDANLLLFVVPDAGQEEIEKLQKSGNFRKKRIAGETYYHCKTKSCRAIFWWEGDAIFLVTSCLTLPTPFETAREIRRSCCRKAS